VHFAPGRISPNQLYKTVALSSLYENGKFQLSGSRDSYSELTEIWHDRLSATPHQSSLWWSRNMGGLRTYVKYPGVLWADAYSAPSDFGKLRLSTHFELYANKSESLA